VFGLRVIPQAFYILACSKSCAEDDVVKLPEFPFLVRRGRSTSWCLVARISAEGDSRTSMIQDRDILGVE
jgi:hypothetical protein